MSKQTISEFKKEGAECLVEFKRFINKNHHERSELDRLEYIDKKFGEHPLFIQAKKQNYDARANAGWGGFGSPDCYCHINPPCENCIAWTNTCKERDGEEKGCMQVKHDCEMAELYNYDLEQS